MLNPTRINAPRSGKMVSLLVSIITLACPSWLTVSSEIRRRKSCTISIGHEKVIGRTSDVQKR